MASIDTRPEFTEDDVYKYLSEFYGISHAIIKPLPSYVDQNFYVASQQEQEFVFKISNMQEDKGIWLFFNTLFKIFCCLHFTLISILK